MFSLWFYQSIFTNNQYTSPPTHQSMKIINLLEFLETIYQTVTISGGKGHMQYVIGCLLAWDIHRHIYSILIYHPVWYAYIPPLPLVPPKMGDIFHDQIPFGAIFSRQITKKCFVQWLSSYMKLLISVLKCWTLRWMNSSKLSL